MWIVKSEVLVLLLSYICLDLKDDVKSKDQENEEVVWTGVKLKRRKFEIEKHQILTLAQKVIDFKDYIKISPKQNILWTLIEQLQCLGQEMDE